MRCVREDGLRYAWVVAPMGMHHAPRHPALHTHGAAAWSIYPLSARCALPLARQVTTREHKARPGLEAVVDKIQRVLEGVCREVQRQARLYQESVRDQAELQVGEDERREGG